MNPDQLLDQVLAHFRYGDERERQVVHALLLHLHAFAREVDLTHDEWRRGVDFLAEVGRWSDAQRSEMGLLSDVSGLSSLVDLIASPPQATPGSVLGPFHRSDAPRLPNPADLMGEQPGTEVRLCGRVVDAAGAGIAAEVDFWQSADNGLYPQQDPAQPEHNLRGRLDTDGDGRFELRTLLPRPYAVPTDGPVGALLHATGRTAMRPAHFHFIVGAAGQRTLTTEIFFAGDPYLASDAVFGVRPELIVPVEIDTAGSRRVNCVFRLAPGAAG